MFFDVKLEFSEHSKSVFGVDLHLTKPWLLTGRFDGIITIYNHESGTIIRTFTVKDFCVFCVKFIARKNWFIAGSSNGQIRVFNYDTGARVAAFNAHSSYIRCLAVHPTDPIILTGSWDKTIKAWDWSKRWRNVQTYAGHTNYVKSIAINPADHNTFVSASIDGSVKMWSFASRIPNFTIQAHDKGINHVEFYPGSDKPYLVTASYDKTIKIWDYRSKRCIRTLEAHANVSFAVFHPNLPIIISGSKDGSLKVWSSEIYDIEGMGKWGLGCPQCITFRKDTNDVAVGYEHGVLFLELEHKHRGYKFSIDHTGILTYTRNHKVFSANLQTLDTTIASTSDGVQIPLQIKDIGSTQVLASAILHSPDGRFVAVVGHDKYAIYTALTWRHKLSGSSFCFAWGPDSNTCAILDIEGKLKIYESFIQITKRLSEMGQVGYALYSGPVLGMRGFKCVTFWDWETGFIVKTIDVCAKNVYWSGTGTHVAITSFDKTYIFYFDRDAYQDAIAKRGPPSVDEGIPESFTLLFTLDDTIQSAKWIGDLLIYTTPTHQERMESYMISPIKSKQRILGYIPAHGKVYVVDDDMKMFGFALNYAAVEFQTAVLRGDTKGAKELLRNVPKEQLNKVMKFLHDRDMKEFACTTLTMELIANRTTNHLISELKDDKAQDMADFLSKMVEDEEAFTHHKRKHSLHLLSKLAKSAEVFPQSLELEGVHCNLAYPVAWGGYGVIFKGEYEGSVICVKAVQLDLEGNNRKKMRAQAGELIIWAHISHRNVLPFLGIYPSEEQVPRVCIVSPWMNNGDLLQYLKKVPNARRLPLVRDIMSGLLYLHDLDIIHADLKAKNVLVSETGRAMLTDFGISRLSITQTTTVTNSGGSLYWMAPELLLGKKLPSRESDIWAFACTCYEIMTLATPFSQHSSFPMLHRAFRKGDIVPLKPAPGIGWDEDVWMLAMRCWRSDPASRPDAHELLDRINSLNSPDDFSQPEPRRKRSYANIDYDRISTILDEICQLDATPQVDEEHQSWTDGATDVGSGFLTWLKCESKKARKLLCLSSNFNDDLGLIP